MYQTSTTRARARRLLQHKADKEVSPKLGDIHGCRHMAVTQGLRIWSKGWSVGSSRNPTKHGRQPFDGTTHFHANITVWLVYARPAPPEGYRMARMPCTSTCFE